VIWLLFTAAVMVSFAVGSASYGMKAAGVEFRGYFYLCAAALYCASFPFDSRRMKALVTVWLAGAGALVALAGFAGAPGRCN